MKNLSEYTEAGFTEIFAKTGAFYAFSNVQFEESKKEGITYVNMGSGLLCPKQNADLLFELMKKNIQNGIAKDIAENGLEQIIKRELINHEAYYTGSIEDTLDSLGMYNVTEEQVLQVFKVERE